MIIWIQNFSNFTLTKAPVLSQSQESLNGLNYINSNSVEGEAAVKVLNNSCYHSVVLSECECSQPGHEEQRGQTCTLLLMLTTWEEISAVHTRWWSGLLLVTLPCSLAKFFCVASGMCVCVCCATLFFPTWSILFSCPSTHQCFPCWRPFVVVSLQQSNPFTRGRQRDHHDEHPLQGTLPQGEAPCPAHIKTILETNVYPSMCV